MAALERPMGQKDLLGHGLVLVGVGRWTAEVGRWGCCHPPPFIQTSRGFDMWFWLITPDLWFLKPSHLWFCECLQGEYWPFKGDSGELENLIWMRFSFFIVHQSKQEYKHSQAMEADTLWSVAQAEDGSTQISQHNYYAALKTTMKLIEIKDCKVLCVCCQLKN